MRIKNREKNLWWQAIDDEDLAVSEHLPLRKMRKPKREREKEDGEAIGGFYPTEREYDFTYQASRHERQWLLTALGAFYDDSLITDVLRIVKGGKEANVYCCQAHAALGMPLLAAKVYRPRLLRNLKNDALYKEGRAVLGDDGKALRDHRSKRAILKKTRIGSGMSITSWIEHEFQSLKLLYEAGASVPKPVIQAGNAILMEYIGDERSPAPALTEVALQPGEVQPIFDHLVRNIEVMLFHNRIHADLSAYNILYWDGKVTIIDFPQVVDPVFNPQGYSLLARDVERICQYFGRYHLRVDPHKLASDLWNRYLGGQ